LVIEQISNLYSLKREPYIKRACKSIALIYNKLGKEDFEELLKQINKEYHLNIFESMVKSVASKNKNKESGSIKDLIKQIKNNK
jgi:hypothetical protein